HITWACFPRASSAALVVEDESMPLSEPQKLRKQVVVMGAGTSVEYQNARGIGRSVFAPVERNRCGRCVAFGDELHRTSEEEGARSQTQRENRILSGAIEYQRLRGISFLETPCSLPIPDSSMRIPI